MHLYLKPEYRGKALGRDIARSCERPGVFLSAA